MFLVTFSKDINIRGPFSVRLEFLREFLLNVDYKIKNKNWRWWTHFLVPLLLLNSAVVPQNWQISGMHFSWQTDFFFAKIIFFVTDTHRPCAPAMNIDHHLHPHHLGNWAARRWGSRLQHDFSLTHLLNVAQGQIKRAWSHKTRVILILSSTSPQGLLLNL